MDKDLWNNILSAVIKNGQYVSSIISFIVVLLKFPDWYFKFRRNRRLDKLEEVKTELELKKLQHEKE